MSSRAHSKCRDVYLYDLAVLEGSGVLSAFLRRHKPRADTAPSLSDFPGYALYEVPAAVFSDPDEGSYPTRRLSVAEAVSLSTRQKVLLSPNSLEVLEVSADQAWSSLRSNLPGAAGRSWLLRELLVSGAPVSSGLVPLLVEYAEAHGRILDLVGHPNTPAEVLASYADAGADDSLLLAMVSGHPNTAVDVLVALASSGYPVVRAAVAANPRLPGEVLEQLAGDESELVRASVLKRLSLPRDVVLWDTLTARRPYSPQVVEVLASHPDTPLDVLTRLARQLVAESPLSPELAAVAAHRNTNESLLAYLTQFCALNDAVVVAVANNPETHPRTLCELLFLPLEGPREEIQEALSKSQGTFGALAVQLYNTGHYQDAVRLYDDVNTVVGEGESAGLPEDYRMHHQPNEDGAPGYDLTVIAPADIYTKPHVFMSPRNKGFAESVAAIRMMRNDPDCPVTIYRAVPSEVAAAGRAFEPGNWVSVSKEYAEQHLESNLAEGVVVSKQVTAKDIRWPGDYLPEWGYFPA